MKLEEGSSKILGARRLINGQMETDLIDLNNLNCWLAVGVDKK